jgi:hypothetical protein
MKLINFASALLISSAVIQPSHAQTSEGAIVRGMRNLGANWQALSNSADILVVTCRNNNFRGIRLIKAGTVSVDLQKTNSIMSPYLGIVRFTGRFYSNGSGPDQVCFETSNEAKQNTDFSGNDRDYQFEAYYQVNGNELQLSGGNEVFTNAFIRQGRPQLQAGSAWHKAFRYLLK